MQLYTPYHLQKKKRINQSLEDLRNKIYSNSPSAILHSFGEQSQFILPFTVISNSWSWGFFCQDSHQSNLTVFPEKDQMWSRRQWRWCKVPFPATNPVQRNLPPWTCAWNDGWLGFRCRSLSDGYIISAFWRHTELLLSAILWEWQRLHLYILCKKHF